MKRLIDTSADLSPPTPSPPSSRPVASTSRPGFPRGTHRLRREARPALLDLTRSQLMESTAPFTLDADHLAFVTPCAAWPGPLRQGHPRALAAARNSRALRFGELGAADLLGLCLPRSSVARTADLLALASPVRGGLCLPRGRVPRLSAPTWETASSPASAVTWSRTAGWPAASPVRRHLCPHSPNPVAVRTRPR